MKPGFWGKSVTSSAKQIFIDRAAWHSQAESA
jgi:hypothetical protein